MNCVCRGSQKGSLEMRCVRLALVLSAVVAVGAGTASCSPSATQAPGSTWVSTAAPSAARTPVPSAVAQTMFGSFDLNAMKQRYGSTFTTATVEGGRIRYVTNIGGVAGKGVDFDFMVEPNDPTKNIIQASVSVWDITRAPTAAETGAINSWFSDLQGSQPDAVSWIRGHYSDYLQAPGAELNIKQSFGPVGAGFFTLVPGLTPLAGAPATIVGFYVEDSKALGH